MPIFRINRTYKNLQRFQHIVNILLKHGFAQTVEQTGLDKAMSFGKRILTFRWAKKEDLNPSIPFPQRFRMVLTDLGPTFVKFGQILSTRPDLLPENLIAELSKLQDQVPPVPFKDIVASVDHALGKPWKKVFKSIEPVALASASIAQVHGGVLLTGEEVVLKIQRPGVEATIQSDMDLLFTLASLAETYIPESKLYSPVALVEEFSRNIKRELDFFQEASNTAQFRQLFETWETIIIPKVYWDCSAKALLTLERVSGCNIDNVVALTRWNISPKQVARTGAEIFLTQVLEFGVFHADPHPGNVFVLPDGRLCLLDFGSVGRVDRDIRDHLISLLFALQGKDYDRLVRGLITLGLLPDDVDQRRLRRDLMELIDPYFGQPLKNLAVGPILEELMRLTRKYQSRTLPELFMLVRAFVIVEGVGRKLDPDMDILAIGEPFIHKMIRDRFSPQRLAMDTLRATSDAGDMMRALPDQVRVLLNKTLRNELITHVNLQGLEEFRDVVDSVGNRVALSLTICALVIGSSILVLANQGAPGGNYPSAGMIGFGVAGFLGLWLMFSIIKSRRF